MPTWRTLSFAASKSASVLASCPNAMMTRCPLNISSNCPFNWPIRFWYSRKLRRVRLPTKPTSPIINGKTIIEPSASQKLIENIMTRMPTSVSIPVKSSVTFWASTRLMASRSLVRRLINSPCGCRSKKLSESVCR